MSRVFVKNSAPIFVRMYNFFLVVLIKLFLISNKLNKKEIIKKLDPNQDGVIIKAVNKFIENVNANNLNPSTIFFIKSEVNRTISNRKKIFQHFNTIPSLKKIKLSNLIFIIGLPRTGTTELQKMFSLLDSHRVLQLWELQYPTSFFEGSDAVKKAKRRTKKYSFLQNFSKPEQKYIHPVETEHPDECFRLLFNSFTSIAVSSALGLDDYEKWVLQTDMLETYKEYKDQLKILFQTEPDKNLILKAPEHLWNLDTLTEVFPKARFIMTHRDPLKSIASYSSMISMFRRTAYKKPNFEKLGLYVTNVFQQGLSSAYRVRKQIQTKSEFIDVHCDDINNSQIKTFMNICKELNININNKSLKKLKEYVAKKTMVPTLSHGYIYKNYGIDKKLIKDKFKFYDHRRYLLT